MLPRLLWVRQATTLKELHFAVFKHMRFAFAEWADWSHPDSERQPKPEQKVLKNMIAFPYRRNPEGPQMTKAEFDLLSDEEAFLICNRGIVSGSHDGNI